MCDDLLGDENSCCDDEIAIVVIDEDQQVSTQLISIVPKLTILFTFNFDFPSTVDPINNQRACIENFKAPPPKATQPLYLLNSTYIFYG